MLAARKTGWLVMLLLSAVAAWGQQPYYFTLNRQIGLSSDEVYNVFQDSRGFIWLTTGEGLCRYDGNEYIPYRSDVQSSLAGSNIQEDKYGRIWYENFDGYIYYTDSGKLKSIDQSTPFYYVPFGISTNHLFVTSKTGVNIYDLKSLKFIKAVSISNLSIRAVGADESYYVLADNKLYRIGADLRVQSVSMPENKNNMARNIFADDRYVYITSMSNAGTSLSVYNSALQVQQTIPILQANVVQSGACIDSQIYINTPSGSYVYNRSGTPRTDVSTYFKGKSISGVIKDRQNNFWFSTTNEGVHIVPDVNNRIYNIDDYSPSRMASAPDGIYAGTRTGEVLHISANFDTIETISHSPGNSAIYSLYADHEQIIYSAAGFTILPVSGRYKELKSPLPVKQVVRLDEKYYAFASSVFFGLVHNPAGNSLKPSIWDRTFQKGDTTGHRGMANIMSIVRAKSVAYDTDAHLIFFASNRGLFVADPDTVRELTSNGHKVYANSLQAANGYLYALSSMGLLLKIPYAGYPNTTARTDTPLLNNISIMKRFDSELYLLGSSGLYTLNLSSGRLNKLDISIDIQGINDILKKDGQMYVATNMGIIALSNAGKAGRKPALLYINSITAGKRTIYAQLPNNLAYNENNIIVNYSVLDFGTLQPALVYYRINDGEWQEIPKDNRALQFPSLSAGQYTLSLRLGTDGASIRSFNFAIRPAFWKQWWFYLICLVVVVGLVITYSRKQIQARIKKLEIQRQQILLEQDLSKSMLTSIRAQMNPHFFYNALNTIQAYIFMNDKIKANNYLAKFSRLTRTVLEMSEAENVALSDEAETMKLYLELEKMRFDSSFEYDISFEGVDNKEMIEIPSMIIQPYVENAIKHGLLHKSGDKTLHIAFECADNLLIVSIDDNGIGRRRSEELNRIKEEKYRSFSTRASEKRIELLNKGRTEKIAVEITDKLHDNGSAAGTLVVLKLPI